MTHGRILLASALLAAGVGAQTRSSEPAKLDLKLAAEPFRTGHPIDFTVSLLDLSNRPAPARRDTAVAISVRTGPQDAKQVSSLTIRKGQSSAAGTMPAPASAGVWYAWAKSPPLMLAGRSFRVRAAPGAPAVALRFVRPPEVNRPPAPVAAAPAEATPLPEPPPPPPPSAVPVTLSFSPQRDIWADGKDAVTLSAFYLGQGDGPPSDLQLRFEDGTGTMKPNPIVIPAGKDEGSAEMTFAEAGAIDVKFLRANPDVNLIGDTAFRFNFVPAPAANLRVLASPPSITLAETAQLIVELVDETGHAAPAAADTQVMLRIGQGAGQLAPAQVTIPHSQPSASVTFSPVRLGTSQIEAESAGFASQPAAVTVGLPWTLIAISILGGFLGGLLAAVPGSPKAQWWKNRRVEWRLLTGVITGFFLYWAVCLGLLNLGAHMPLLNPFTALILAMLGGWLGTGVFALAAGKNPAGA